MKTVTFKCDICDTLIPMVGDEEIKETKIQVIFHTDQTEGRGCKPYLSNEKLHVCPDCKKKILAGNYLHGSGAQGHNKYEFQLEPANDSQ